jgi:hypothetical protein
MTMKRLLIKHKNYLASTTAARVVAYLSSVFNHRNVPLRDLSTVIKCLIKSLSHKQKPKKKLRMMYDKNVLILIE